MYLSKADEIKMEYRDYQSIPDVFERYPDKPIIVQIPASYQDKEIDWQELNIYSRMKPGLLICCISNFKDIQICKDNKLDFYYGYPIATYVELNYIISQEPRYLVLDAPLFFELPNIKKLTDIPIRAIANIATHYDIPEYNGISGTWIRPEDVEVYEPYISVIEFENCDNRREQAYYRIYAQAKNWPGEVSKIIDYCKTDALNRLIIPDFGQKRISCGQRCEKTGGASCHFCDLTLKLANKEKIQAYADFINGNQESEQKDEE